MGKWYDQQAEDCAYVTQPSVTTQASLLETATALFLYTVGSLAFLMMYAGNFIPVNSRPAIP